MMRIVWAMDPFAEDKKLQANILKVLHSLAVIPGTTIEPVALVTFQDRALVSLPVDTIEQVQAAAEASMSKWIAKSKLPSVSRPTVLVQKSMSLTEAVLRLVEWAKSHEADLIAVSTQAHKGATRFLLGSFSETLILESTLPTLIVAPQTEAPKRVRKILYPTDWSPVSRSALATVLPAVGKLGAEIYLFHYTAEEPNPALARSFLEDAQRAGVAAHAAFSKRGTSVSHAVVEFAKKQRMDWIAMVSHRAPGVSRVTVGSNTRQVVRIAPCPVWVVHP